MGVSQKENGFVKGVCKRRFSAPKGKVIHNIFHKGKNPKDEENRRFSAPKGYIYTLEVLIAISLILVSVVFIFRNPPAKPEFGISTMKIQGLQALEYIDNKGDLKILVFQENETELENRIKNILPIEARFETEICNFSCSAANVPLNETVVGIDYYASGYKENYVGKKARLWIWRRS